MPFAPHSVRAPSKGAPPQSCTPPHSPPGNPLADVAGPFSACSRPTGGRMRRGKEAKEFGLSRLKKLPSSRGGSEPELDYPISTPVGS